MKIKTASLFIVAVIASVMWAIGFFVGSEWGSSQDFNDLGGTTFSENGSLDGTESNKSSRSKKILRNQPALPRFS